MPAPNVVARAEQVWQNAKKPADIVAVLDVSDSMNAGTKLAGAKQTLIDFIGQLSNSDRLAVLVFSDAITTLAPLDEIGPKRQQVIDGIESVTAQNAIRLYDATDEAHKLLAAQGHTDAIRAVVLLTDRHDEKFGPDGQSVIPGGSTVTKEELLQRIGDNPIKIYTIAYGDGADTTTLKDIAKDTGDQTFIATPDSGRHVYEEIRIVF